MATVTPHTSIVLQDPDISIHVFHSSEDDGGEAVNSVVMETSSSLVLFDMPPVYPVAVEIEAFVQSLKKPIRKIVISHGHPDHWFGLARFPDAPSFASAGTIAEISQFGASYLAFKQTQFPADQLPPSVAVPKTEMDSSEEDIDGVVFSWKRVNRAEYAEGIYLTLPQHRVMVAADLIYNDVHLYLGQKDDAGFTAHGWLAALKALNPADYDIIVPGHGKVGDAQLIANCIDYIETVLPWVEAPDATAQTYMAAARRLHPDYRVDELLDLTAYFAFGSQT